MNIRVTARAIAGDAVQRAHEGARFMLAGALRKVEPPHPRELPHLMEREFVLRAQLAGRACAVDAAAAAFGHEFRGLLEHRTEGSQLTVARMQ